MYHDFNFLSIVIGDDFILHGMCPRDDGLGVRKGSTRPTLRQRPSSSANRHTFATPNQRPAAFAFEIFAVCESLSSLYTTRTGNRTLDILHLACASHLDLKDFASFDRRQRGLAKRLGLRLLPESLEA
ncbi:MAG: hypothetical protein ACP5I4_14685 [Oceanipulchritudo sp.]